MTAHQVSEPFRRNKDGFELLSSQPPGSAVIFCSFLQHLLNHVPPLEGFPMMIRFLN